MSTYRFRDHDVVTKTQGSTSQEDNAAGVNVQQLEVDRRSFFRLVGAAALPLLTKGCTGEAAEALYDQDRALAIQAPSFLQVNVKHAFDKQAILDKQEHLSIDAALHPSLSLGDQCRIILSDDDFALYTVGEVRNEVLNKRVRMGPEARERLGINSIAASAVLDTRVVAANLSDEEAKAQGEFVERLVDDGVSDGFVVIAPHGGSIEPGTDQQAELVQAMLAAKGASSWICKGYKPGGGAYTRWHITSTDLSPNSFPGLDQIADRGFTYAVTFHGQKANFVLVGGGAPKELRELIRDAIADAIEGSGIDVEVAEPGDSNAGFSAENIVNWMTADGLGGVQIEQCMEARKEYGLDIAAAVAGVFEDLL